MLSKLVLNSATTQLALLSAGEVSIEELAEAHIAQIGRLEPKINAFADFDAERVRAAVDALRAAGYRVEPFLPKTLELLRQLWWRFFVQTGAMFYAPEIKGREHRLSPVFEEFLSIARSEPPLTATELLDAWAQLDLVRARTLEEMREFPLLLCPVASIPAFKHDERVWMVEGRPVEWLDAWRYSQWWNALANPAAVIPVGRSAEGMPIAVQVAGRPFEDEVVLEVAGEIDRAFGYRPPPLALGGA